MKKRNRRLIIFLVLFILLIPLVPLIMWSFTWRWDFPNVLPEFDMWAWGEIGSDKILRSIGVSIPLSVSVVLLALLLSFFPAKIIGTTEFKGKKALELLLLLPTFIPQISIVFGMQNVFRVLGIYSTILGIIIAQLVFQVPYMTLLLSAVFKNYSVLYEQQSACLGVCRWKTLWHVTLPMVRAGVMVSCVFSFIGSWGNYLVTAVIAPVNLQTLPMLLFPMMSSGNNSYPLIAAVTLVYIAPVLLFFIFSSKIIIGEGNDPRRGKVL